MLKVNCTLHGVLVGLALMLGSVSANAQSCEPDKVTTKYPKYAGKTVKISVSPTSPPYTYADPDNQERMVGLEVEMIEKAMACAGLKFEYLKGPWSAAMSSLFSGGSDLMIGSVNYRPDRAERADFILYYRAGHGIVVAMGNPKKLGDLETLCGANGTATIGSSSALLIEQQSKACLEKGKEKIGYQPATETEGAYRQLPLQRFDFVMDDAVTAAAHVSKKPDLEIAHTVISGILSGMIVQKGNKEMLQIVADGLAIQQRGGEITNLAKKYGFPAHLLIPIETRQ